MLRIRHPIAASVFCRSMVLAAKFGPRMVLNRNMAVSARLLRVVVALDFPLLSSHLPDALEIAVSEQERIVGGWVSAWFGIPARRDVDLDGSALFEGPFAEQCVDLTFVIGPVAADSVEGGVRLFKQRPDLDQ